MTQYPVVFSTGPAAGVSGKTERDGQGGRSARVGAARPRRQRPSGRCRGGLNRLSPGGAVGSSGLFAFNDIVNLYVVVVLLCLDFSEYNETNYHIPLTCPLSFRTRSLIIQGI